MDNKSKIKEISVMVYRKYTEDFDSLGYRLGITLELEDGDARDAWYQGRLFLDERIKEEELLIDRKFEWLKEKKKGFPDVKVETDVIKVKSKPEGMNLVEIPMEKDVYLDKSVYIYPCKNIDDAITRIMFMTDMTKINVNDAVRNLMLMGVSEKEALMELGALKGVELKFVDESEKERSVIDVKKIIATSPKAVLVLLFEGVQKWIPKSCIEGGELIDNLEKNVKTMLFVDKWFLEKEGIIGKDAEIRYDAELKK